MENESLILRKIIHNINKFITSFKLENLFV